MTVEKLGKDFCLDGAGFDLLHFFLVGSIRLFERELGKFRINSRDECDIFAIGTPNCARGFGRKVGDLPSFAAPNVDGPKLGFARARGFKENAFAIGAPAGVPIFFIGGGKPFRRVFSCYISQPKVGRGFIRIEIHLGDNVGDPKAIWADLSIGNPEEFKKIIYLHGSCSSCNRCGHAKDCN